MPDVTAPYRFVPLSNLIVYPSWANKASHDKPFKDGISGEITIALKNQTPLCVGGQQSSSSEYEAGKIHFYRTPDGKLSIPGSSLKGMLKNVLEIASFSPMRQVEDQKLGVRDLTPAGKFYTEAIIKQKAESGWLKFDEQKGWVIYPCSYARVHQQQIIDTFKLSYKDWTDCQTVMDRYYKIGVCPDIKFEQTEEKNGKQLTDISRTQGNSGVLVMTGQPGAAFDKSKGAKKYEFVFFNTQDSAMEVSSTVMSGFRQIHQDTKEWQFWQQNINTLKHGVPVFYHTDGNSVRSLGLAMMYKLPYKNSIHDAVGHTNAQHVNDNLNADSAGMADLLFGYLGEKEGESGLRGRVQIGFAAWQGNTPLLQFSPEVVLSAPKPTYYPAYIYQDGKGNGFNQLMQNHAKIAGWKRYQAKAVEDYPKLEAKVLQNKKVQVRLETLANESQFHFKIRLHNIRPVELGALLWSLDFGESDKCCHALGTGKPFGLGQVKLSIVDSRLVLNDGKDIKDETAWLAGCRIEFQKYMNNVFEANSIATITKWEDCDVIKALREYATPSHDIESYQYLSTPKDYADLKKREYIDDFAKDFHQYEPIEIDDPKQIKVVEYQSNIDESIEDAKAQLVEQAKTKVREKAKQSATEEEMALYEIEDFIAKAKQELTNTMKEDAHKILKESFTTYKDTFTDEQKTKLQMLSNELSELVGTKKQLDKVVKQINKWS
ncbi:CRISPR-associated protein (TIGR03986 family) [Psychrobacter luti]|uniref:CRISPR-associated protein (TIGR03986 family) n=1 Tax=Psychrobacter luti TaxID=198481 RepID=A0A839T9N1_9GAMM|nr:TIGR03986 family CRISPR-associated RAMP protein [Psychrobacter luti]MBB3106127.1 CRISPR-associated protein (TIGR03986 family) [Psychrobacter luti]